MVLNGPNGHRARLLLSNSSFSGGSAVILCGEALRTLVLEGALVERNVGD